MTTSASTPETGRPNRPAVGPALTAGLAMLLVAWAPSHLDAAGWSRFDPFWLRLWWGLCLGWALLLGWAASRLDQPGDAVVFPLLVTAPTLVLKPQVTALPDLAAAPLLLAVVALAWLVARTAGRQARLALLLAGLLLATPAVIRYGELAAAEAIIADGRAEALLVALADAAGQRYQQDPTPPRDIAAWLAELGQPGWQAEGDRVWWAPAEGVGPGPLHLRFQPVAMGGSVWDPILTGGPTSVVSPKARRFTAAISADGSLRLEWPDGRPPGAPAQTGGQPH